MSRAAVTGDPGIQQATWSPVQPETNGGNTQDRCFNSRNASVIGEQNFALHMHIEPEFEIR